jgi:hypothetical protein
VVASSSEGIICAFPGPEGKGVTLGGWCEVASGRRHFAWIGGGVSVVGV